MSESQNELQGKMADTSVEAIWTVDILLPEKKKRTIRFIFPDEDHSPTHPWRGDLVTNAEIAGMYIKTGKWREWFGSMMSSVEGDASKMLNVEFAGAVSNQIAIARKEWNRALHMRDSKAQLSEIRKQIREFRDKHRNIKNRINSLVKPDFAIEAFKTDKSAAELRREFYANKKLLLADKKSAWLRIAELRDKLERKKRELYKTFLSTELKDSVEELSMLITEAEETGSIEARRVYEKQLEILTEPYAVANSIDGALDRIASQMSNDIKDIMHASHGPALSPKTISNRRSMGIDSSIPLDETGEFIESLKYVII